MRILGFNTGSHYYFLGFYTTEGRTPLLQKLSFFMVFFFFFFLSLFNNKEQDTKEEEEEEARFLRGSVVVIGVLLVV